jgi:hypothetical protein
MQRGQISIDLLITLIIVIMIVSAFTLILTGFQKGHEEFFLRTQLSENATKLATFITSTNSLSDTNFTTKILVQPVNYKNISRQPFITINPGEITLTMDTNDGLVKESAFFSTPPGSNVTVVDKLMVVTNE